MLLRTFVLITASQKIVLNTAQIRQAIIRRWSFFNNNFRFEIQSVAQTTACGNANNSKTRCLLNPTFGDRLGVVHQLITFNMRSRNQSQKPICLFDCFAHSSFHALSSDHLAKLTLGKHKTCWAACNEAAVLWTCSWHDPTKLTYSGLMIVIIIYLLSTTLITVEMFPPYSTTIRMTKVFKHQESMWIFSY